MKALRFLTQDMLLAKSFYAALCGLRPAAAFGLLACLLFPGTSHGYDPSVSLSELRHAVWRSEEGAPSNVVALAQTPDGFLWLGTGAGLFRFDGVRFERITTLGSKALLAASITALHTTLSGDLVIGYRFGGVSIMRGTEIEHFSAADGLPRSNAWAFAQGDDGDLWAAFTNGVFRKRAGVWQMFALDGEMLPYRTILRDGEGNIWVSARTGAFVFPKGASAFQRADVALRRFPSLSVAPDGRVWAADFDRLRIGPLVQEGSTFRLAPDQDHVPLPRTGDLHWFDSGGALWIRTGEGLVRIARTSLNQGSDSGEPFGAAKEPNCFLEDREGNIWLGAADGLHRFSQGNVRRVEFGANGGGRVAVAAAGGSDVWATTEFGGLFRIGATVESLGHISRHASHLYRDRDGVIWVGSRDALWRVDDNNTAKEISRPDSGKDEHAPIFAPIHAIARDRSGSLWVHVVSKGTFRLTGDRWSALDSDPWDRVVMSMGNDTDGRLWIGYVFNGASRVDGDEVLSFGPDSGLDIGAVYAVHGRGPRVWFGGERGLALFDGVSMRTLNMRGLGETSVITGIVETASGQLWISAANGLTLIEAAEWHRALADPEYTVTVRRFDANDGLLGSASQIRPLPSLIEAGDGRLWMALPTGLFVIDPLLLQRNQMAPSVIIRALFVDGKEMTTNDTIAMPVGRADLRFDYTATSLTVPQRVRFRYKLEGYDSEWRDAGDRREASYTRVGPGRYVFRVMACNNDGVWNEIGASLALDVPPTFWQTRWFDLLAVTAGLSLMWLLYRLRLWQVSGQIRRRMESRLQERERIARELHDTLLQSITGLTLHVRAAANQIQVGTALRERLETALARANEALVEGRDRVSELRLHQGPEVSLESRLTNACNNLADEMPGVHCGIKVTGAIRDLNTLVSEEAERIAREAVTNALRHADARDIQVVLDYGRYAFRLSVGDDGSGINGPVEAQPDQPGHFGLAGMRERAARIGGQLEIRSSRHGTTVVLTVPAATADCPFRQERV